MFFRMLYDSQVFSHGSTASTSGTICVKTELKVVDDTPGIVLKSPREPNQNAHSYGS